MIVVDLSWDDVGRMAERVVKQVWSNDQIKGNRVYPIPSGGIAAAFLLQQKSKELFNSPLEIVETADDANFYVDDIVDSGTTKKRFSDKPFFALLDKQEKGLTGTWYRFPWERIARIDSCEDNVRRIIEYIGDDPNREGLVETPRRVVKAYGELFSGYKQDPSTVLKIFEDGACDEMVVTRTEFFSICEHHMLPFFGVAWIGYLPNKRVAGVSKLSRLLEVFARRLQIQERLCQQVTQALDTYLNPLGSACIIRARHLCMEMRGVRKQNSLLVTSSLTGVFRENATARQELLSLAWKDV